MPVKFNSTATVQTWEGDTVDVLAMPIGKSPFAITPSVGKCGPINDHYNLTHVPSGIYLVSSKKPRTLAKFGREVWGMIAENDTIREFWESFKGGLMPRDMTPDGMRERVVEFERIGK